jgi:hypothetical protein
MHRERDTRTKTNKQTNKHARATEAPNSPPDGRFFGLFGPLSQQPKTTFSLFLETIILDPRVFVRV